MKNHMLLVHDLRCWCIGGCILVFNMIFVYVMLCERNIEYFVEYRHIIDLICKKQYNKVIIKK
jgi:hypothetical protein